MKRKIRHIIYLTLIISYIVVSLSFVSSREKEINCKGLRISITDSADYRFVLPKHVVKMLDRNKFSYVGKGLKDINTLDAETLVYQFPAVKQADAYVSIDGYLNISIQQREPIVRIVNHKQQSYYLDAEGKIMPVSTYFSAYTLVVNGHIKEPFRPDKNRSVFQYDSTGNLKPNILSDIFTLTKFIENSSLWKSQIVQVYVKQNGDFILVPRVGPHTIIIGDISNLENKFFKLKEIYKVMNESGWNQYKIINLKYKNQIICTKNE